MMTLDELIIATLIVVAAFVIALIRLWWVYNKRPQPYSFRKDDEKNEVRQRFYKAMRSRDVQFIDEVLDEWAKIHGTDYEYDVLMNHRFVVQLEKS